MGNKKNEFKIREVMKIFPDCRFEGNPKHPITHAFPLNNPGKNPENGVTWVSDKNLAGIKKKINAGLLILSEKGYSALKDKAHNFLVSPNPRLSFLQLISNRFAEKRKAKIEKSAHINSSAKIGKRCYIGRNVVIEENAVIGNDTQILHNSVILSNTIVGSNVTIGCNCTIGNYGFGYEKESNGRHTRLEHIGNVIIHDHVEIHNNTCIDRAVMGSTIIEENCKIDNQVHIAHGVHIKENSLIIANALIGGSTVIGKDCWIGPTSTIKNKLTIGDNTLTGIGAVVVKDINSGTVVIGNPAEDIEQYKKWSKLRAGIMDKKS